MKKITSILSLTLLALTSLTGCDEADCTLNNIVECKMAFYNREGKAAAMKDTLSIYAESVEMPLLNRGIKVSSVGIPLSYFKDKDTLQLVATGNGYLYEDWVEIEKENIEHFESLDCPVKMFHVLKGVKMLTHEFIDSIRIVEPRVEYYNGENIKIYVRTDL